MRIILPILLLATSTVFGEDVKKLSAPDLAVQTHKWDGKTIETQVRCFYADKNEFRCLTASRTRIDFSKVEPAEIRSRMENKCDTLKSVATKECLFTVQFVYGSYDSAETGGLGQQHIIIAKDNAGKFR